MKAWAGWPGGHIVSNVNPGCSAIRASSGERKCLKIFFVENSNDFDSHRKTSHLQTSETLTQRQETATEHIFNAWLVRLKATFRRQSRSVMIETVTVHFSGDVTTYRRHGLVQALMTCICKFRSTEPRVLRQGCQPAEDGIWKVDFEDCLKQANPSGGPVDCSAPLRNTIQNKEIMNRHKLDVLYNYYLFRNQSAV